MGKNYFVTRFVTFLLIFVCLSFTSGYVNASGVFSVWLQETNLPAQIASNFSFSSNNYIFNLGGANNSVPNTGFVSSIHGTGTLSAWSETTTQPPNMYWLSGATKDNYVYLLGGANTSFNNIANVWFGTIADNNVTLWTNTTPLPLPLSLGASAISSDKIFFAGGSTLSNQANNPNFASTAIYVSDINLDGTIGAWRLAGDLQEKTEGHSMMVINNYLVVFGGFTPTGYSNKVIRAQINPNGSIGAWENLSQLPEGMWRFGIARVQDTIMIAGNGSTNTYFSDINPDGTLTPWQNGPTLPEDNCCGQLVASGNNLYLIGGVANGNYSNHVWKVTYTPGSTPSPTTSPTPTPISSPAPTSNKVVLIPGTGASWNLDAFINCKKSDYIGDWTLAPFAKNVYDDLTTVLENTGWNTYPFYYDWRNKIVSNGDLLSTFIDTLAEPQEKINIVGHSMGGLLARSYLEQESGGKAKKLLMVGAPNEGSAISYPLYSGHEVWGNDLVDTIAKTLFLKHCGVPESIQNLLPTTDYIKQNGFLKPINTMVAQNNYLPTDFVYPFWGVKVGTLAGTGFPTLETISVTNPNRSDVRKGLWLDGKPVGKSNNVNGDGTVLVSSAQVNGALNNVINQSHSGLVASTVGISSILEFLGSPGIPDPPYTDPKSALVIVASSGNFWVTDRFGKVVQSESGMVSIINPKDGQYKLRLIPNKHQTKVIVAQFLPGGKSLYKEYDFSGFNIKPKIIDFHSKNSKEDCLKDEYRR